MKKQLNMIFLGVLLICFIVPFNAFAIGVQEEEPDYYLERGQIELNTNMLSANDELSPAIRDVVAEMERRGFEPIGVAYTTVELNVF